MCKNAASYSSQAYSELETAFAAFVIVLTGAVSGQRRLSS